MEIDLGSILLFLHVIGATVLLGTGAGIAFFMVMANRTKDAAIIAHTASAVVVADFVFTASAVILQPVTGIWMALDTGWSLREGWIAYSILLYVIAGLFWLPVISFHIRMRDLARQAAADGTPLPDAYHRLYRTWIAFGFPAFAAVLAIIWIMLAKPDLGLL